MSTFNNLPVIIVCAANDTTAARILSELIDNEVTDIYCKESASRDRVWRIVNKYYTADVRLHALPDGQPLELDPGLVEAHVIHLTEDEVMTGAGAGAAARRAAGAAGAAGRGAGPRVLLADAARAPAALRAWAAAARAELVPLREPARGGDEHEHEPGGWARARAALHAHAWRGLARLDLPAPASPHTPHSPPPAHARGAADGGTSSSEGSAGEEEEEERAVERAEAFAAALDALGEAREAREAGAGPAWEAGEALGARRERAEALLLSFCRALGLDPERC